MRKKQEKHLEEHLKRKKHPREVRKKEKLLTARMQERKIREKQMANTEEREIIKRDDMEMPMAVNGQ